MSKAVIVGAGKTGRGFIARLIHKDYDEIIFIDKNADLVNELNSRGGFNVNFFGGERESVKITNYKAETWENADLEDAELILVSVGGSNLCDVGASLKSKLKDGTKYFIITCENASKPSKTLKDAIGSNMVRVSESTVFCTTIEDSANDKASTVLDINSENYPYLQFDADLLDGYVPEAKALRPTKDFGNFLTRKLYTYNAASCVIAYLGYIKGYTDYAMAANDEEIQKELDRNYEETNKAMCREFGYDSEDQKEFALLSRKKFCSKTIIDTVARNAREPQRKMKFGERVIGPMLLLEKYGLDTSVLEKTTAAMLVYDNEGEEEWRKIKTENTNSEILEKICGLDKNSPIFNRISEYAVQYEKALMGE